MTRGTPSVPTYRISSMTSGAERESAGRRLAFGTATGAGLEAAGVAGVADAATRGWRPTTGTTTATAATMTKPTSRPRRMLAIIAAQAAVDSKS